MAQQLRAVEFNEGEPLDPNKLNDLKHNIIVAYEEAVKNTSDTGQVTRFDSGFVLVDIKKGVGLSAEISLGTLPNAYIITSIGSGLKAGVQATLSIEGSTTKPQIRVSTSPAIDRSNFRINYLLVSKEKTE
jgi:hypothetical protein